MLRVFSVIYLFAVVVIGSENNTLQLNNHEMNALMAFLSLSFLGMAFYLREEKKSNRIIAIGGGAFLNKNIRKEILANHISFWLQWNSQTLIERIANNPKRPIAFNATKSELFDMIKKRSNFYSKAMYKIDCNNLTKNKIIKKILISYENNKT